MINLYYTIIKNKVWVVAASSKDGARLKFIRSAIEPDDIKKLSPKTLSKRKPTCLNSDIVEVSMSEQLSGSQSLILTLDDHNDRMEITPCMIENVAPVVRFDDTSFNSDEKYMNMYFKDRFILRIMLTDTHLRRWLHFVYRKLKEYFNE